jgi:hypothetical protein
MELEGTRYDGFEPFRYLERWLMTVEDSRLYSCRGMPVTCATMGRDIVCWHARILSRGGEMKVVGQNIVRVMTHMVSSKAFLGVNQHIQFLTSQPTHLQTNYHFLRQSRYRLIVGV